MAFVGGKNFTVISFAAGTIVAGDLVPGATSNSTAFGTIRPLSENDLNRLPEGTRLTDKRKFYTEAVLFLAPEQSLRKSDRLTDGVDTWELSAIADNTDHTTGIPHFRYELDRVGADEP